MTKTRLGEIHAEISDAEFLTIGPGTVVRSSTKANTGAYSVRMDLSSPGIGISALSATGIATSFWINHNGLAGDTDLVSVKQTLTANYALILRWMEDEARWDLYIDGVIQEQLATADIAFDATDNWFNIGMTLDASMGYASIYLNGLQVMNYTGSITRSPFDVVVYGQKNQSSGFSTYAYLDDIYADALSSEADAAPPSYLFLPSYVDAAGTNSNWTPSAGNNEDNVDDGAVDDGDATYNKVTTSVGSLRDTFNSSDIVVPLDYAINAVLPFAVVRKLNAADDAQIKLTAFNGIDYDDSAAMDVPTAYGVRRGRFEMQPDGFTPWDESGFNSMEYGYQAAGSF